MAKLKLQERVRSIRDDCLTSCGFQPILLYPTALLCSIIDVDVGHRVTTLTATDTDTTARLEYSLDQRSVEVKDKGSNPVSTEILNKYKVRTRIQPRSTAVLSSLRFYLLNIRLLFSHWYLSDEKQQATFVGLTHSLLY